MILIEFKNNSDRLKSFYILTEKLWFQASPWIGDKKRSLDGVSGAALQERASSPYLIDQEKIEYSILQSRSFPTECCANS